MATANGCTAVVVAVAAACPYPFAYTYICIGYDLPNIIKGFIIIKRMYANIYKYIESLTSTSRTHAIECQLPPSGPIHTHTQTNGSFERRRRQHGGCELLRMHQPNHETYSKTIQKHTIVRGNRFRLKTFRDPATSNQQL